MKFFFLFFLTCFNFAFAQENISRILNSPFPTSQKPDTLYVIYDQNFSENEILAIQSLQGILSQEKPLIYRDVGTGSSIWINDLIENYDIIPNYSINNNFEELITLFKSKIEGYILCDIHTHSSNIATTLSGIYNAITITNNHVKLMTELNIPMIHDVRSKDYNWVLNNYAKSINKKIITYQDPVKDLCLGDYSVFTNSIQFYDNIHSDFTESALNLMQNNSILLGWGADEYQTVNKASIKGIGVLPSDYAYNLSVLTNFNHSINQNEHNSYTETINDTHTVCFVMSDGDNIQWLLNWFFTDQRWFGNQNRGQIDIGWTISPALVELAPTVMNKIYSAAKHTYDGKDYFIAGPSGLSYIYPDSYSNLEAYVSLMNDYMIKSDLKIVNVIGNNDNDFYLYPFVQQESVNAVFYYDFANYSSLNGNIKFINNKPVISGRYNLWGGFESTSSLASKINDQEKNPYSENGYSLIAVHNWSNSVDSIIKCVSLFDNNIRVVSPDKFVNLIKQNISPENNKDDIIYISYPNPTKGIINIEVRLNIDEIDQIKIINSKGQEINKSQYNIVSKYEDLTSISIDLTNYTRGQYFIQLNTKNSHSIIKAIKN
ncbi:MAG: hypothetical protein CMD26_06485 [Flavobacteriales bacterium]|nr:hypothetical protein [Flavobacteriales bacterium]